MLALGTLNPCAEERVGRCCCAGAAHLDFLPLRGEKVGVPEKTEQCSRGTQNPRLGQQRGRIYCVGARRLEYARLRRAYSGFRVTKRRIIREWHGLQGVRAGLLWCYSRSKAQTFYSGWTCCCVLFEGVFKTQLPKKILDFGKRACYNN